MATLYVVPSALVYMSGHTIFGLVLSNRKSYLVTTKRSDTTVSEVRHDMFVIALTVFMFSLSHFF